MEYKKIYYYFVKIFFCYFCYETLTKYFSKILKTKIFFKNPKNICAKSKRNSENSVKIMIFKTKKNISLLIKFLR